MTHSDRSSCPMPETPRTDAFAKIPSRDQSTAGIARDWAEFARQLERELAEANAKMAQMLAAAVADLALDENRLGESALRSQDEVIERCARECDRHAEANEMRGNVIATFPTPQEQHVAEMHIQGAAIARDCATAIRALKASSEKAHD